MKCLEFLNQFLLLIGLQYGLWWEEKKKRHFKCMRFYPFDDEEPPLDYSDNFLNIEPNLYIQLELNEEEDNEIYDFFMIINR